MLRGLSQRGANFRTAVSGDVVTLVAGIMEEMSSVTITSSQAGQKVVAEATLSIAINVLSGVELESMVYWG